MMSKPVTGIQLQLLRAFADEMADSKVQYQVGVLEWNMGLGRYMDKVFQSQPNATVLKLGVDGGGSPRFSCHQACQSTFR